MKSDLLYALRGLWRDKGFTGVAVLSLALGIGANSAIFTLANAIFLSPLPVQDMSRLAAVFWVDGATTSTVARGPMRTSYLNYVDFRARSRNVFVDMTAVVGLEATLSVAGSAPVLQYTQLASANYFDVLGVKPTLGRMFLPNEDRPGLDRVVVLSYAAWQNEFAGNTAVLGQSLSLNSDTYTVIGVAPSGFKGTHILDPPDSVWIPVSMYSHIVAPPLNDLEHRRYRSFDIIGRLKPGIELTQAQDVLRVIANQLEQEHPWDNPGSSAGVIPLSEATLGFLPRDRAVLAAIALGAVAGLILLIACLNVASLLLARAAGRVLEVTTKIALGASRGHLVRQFLAESVLLAALGGVCGLALGWTGNQMFWVLRPASLAGSSLELSLDWRVYLFTGGIALLSTLLFGLAPALASPPPNLTALMNAGGRGGIEGYNRNGLRSWLVAFQVAIAFVTLTAAGLFIRGMQAAQTVDPGFETRNLFVFSLDLNARRVSGAQGQEFLKSMLETAKTVPGVRTVAFATNRPFAGSGSRTMLSEDNDLAALPGFVGSNVAANYVTPSYFEALRLRLRAGRLLNEFDRAGATPVAVINETLAKHFWPGRDALGKRFRLRDEKDHFHQVVGIVADAVEGDIGQLPRPMAYFPLAQEFRPRVTLHVSTASDPAPLLRTVLAKVQPLDNELALTRPATIEDLLAAGLWAPRLGAGLFGLFGILGLVLASVGIYGLMANSVVHRTNEIGIRMALGAAPRDILGLVIRQGLALASIGIAGGAIAALLLAPFARSLLFSIPPYDPAAFLATSAVFAAVAALACWIPAMQAARLNPVSALRK